MEWTDVVDKELYSLYLSKEDVIVRKNKEIKRALNGTSADRPSVD